MSLFPTGVSIDGGQALGLIQQIFFRSRSIGPFTANVTLEERHEDSIRITDHPVERGAVISDHAFKVPNRVTIRCGWSNSSLQALYNPSYVMEVYTNFRILQDSFQPLTILTGKRLYLNNMLIERLTVVTDEKSENALMMVCDCREIQLVDTVTATQAPAANQATPQVTFGVANQGSVALPEGAPGGAGSGISGAIGYTPSNVSAVPFVVQPTAQPNLSSLALGSVQAGPGGG